MQRANHWWQIAHEYNLKLGERDAVIAELHKEIKRLQREAEAGWIEWRGGICPLRRVDTLVDIRYRNGENSRNRRAVDLNWNHYDFCPGADIVSYRIVTEATNGHG